MYHVDENNVAPLGSTTRPPAQFVTTSVQSLRPRQTPIDPRQPAAPPLRERALDAICFTGPIVAIVGVATTAALGWTIPSFFIAAAGMFFAEQYGRRNAQAKG